MTILELIKTLEEEIKEQTNGKFKSYNIINKAQYSSTSSCLDLSFLGLTDGQNNYFLFYDNNRNPNEMQARIEKLKTFEEGGRGKFLSVKVDNENITSEELSLELDKSENLLVRECVKVDDSSNITEISFNNAVIATGSKPTSLPFAKIDKKRIITSTMEMLLE